MLTWLRGTLSTCSFELVRSLTAQRLVLFGFLAAFPALIIVLIGISAGREGMQIPFMETLIILLVGLIGVLALLLTASTGVYSELEGKSWVYIACRPYGRVATVIGKYLAALVLSYGISLLAATLAVMAAQWRGNLPRPEYFWFVTAGLLFLACAVYAAMFTLIGTLFYRRAMVFCAAYMIVVEFMLANIPALIRGLTIRCHLQELAISGYGWIMPLQEEPYRLLYGEYPIWMNFTALALFISVTLGASAFFVMNREYVTGDET
ncbi:MAG: ABC transporter permease [Planctomycetota bacterium]|jgi:ABC-type transport system involved in multi-copper enzyme maturation permease subunit|nr:hypothetical protein [Blastopirellula sp.]